MRKCVDGLVLREQAYGENDKLLTVLTAGEGRLLMTAKGARSMKSKCLPLCRTFTYANFEYYEKNDRRWVSGGAVNDSFFGLNSDLEGFALAAYVAELACEITGEGVEATEVLRMTLNTLYAIEKKLKPYRQIKAVYELFAARTEGMEPELDGCARCRRQEGDFSLDVMNGHLVCGKCRSREGQPTTLPDTDEEGVRRIWVPLDGSALAAMRYVMAAAPGRIFAFGLKDGASMKNFCDTAELYLLHHLERSFDTLDFYRTVKGSQD